MAASSTDRRSPGRTAGDRRWTALIVIAVAQLMTALDATIVNIALPSAQRSLGFGDADRQWVITAYTLTFAGLLLLGGRIADRFGRRRSFLAGLAGFAAASALAGAAPGLPVLMAGRALQGAFAALLAPTALSLIAVTFRDVKERGTAFAVYGAVASSGAAIGLILGGVLTEYLQWRWCLYVNIAVAAAAFVAGRAVLPDPPAGSGARPQVADAALITGGIAAVVLGCAQAAPHGWGSAEVIAPLAVAAVAIAAFLLIQARRAEPLLPPYLLTRPDRIGAYVAVGAAVVGSFGMFLLLTYYFQAVLGYTPLKAGLAFLPMTAAVSGSGYLVAGRILPHVRPRTLMTPGLLLAAAGLALLSTLDVGSGYLGLVLPAEILVGAGMAGVFTPAINVVTGGVDPRDAGVAAAVANTAMQVGGSVGVAVLNTIAVTATHHRLARHTPPGEALVRGFGTAAGSASILLACVAVAVLLVVRTPRSTH
ncbi:MFS transporter [Actinomadura sp. DC4]|uniref:MFS transporter n=1 Tax=Actinomadura sp. DC4 TaxID=3055069 RepID=UPI0025B27F7A|nr:MFS transporter [Actinomadura sp. DC4]MDN3359830.1 MFS transporter [Actinomadura sp. DC4]